MEDDNNQICFLNGIPCETLDQQTVMREKEQQQDELVAKVIAGIKEGKVTEGVKVELIDSRNINYLN